MVCLDTQGNADCGPALEPNPGNAEFCVDEAGCNSQGDCLAGRCVGCRNRYSGLHCERTPDPCCAVATCACQRAGECPSASASSRYAETAGQMLCDYTYCADFSCDSNPCVGCRCDPDPNCDAPTCATVECGPHSQCSDGICSCDAGFRGLGDGSSEPFNAFQQAPLGACAVATFALVIHSGPVRDAARFTQAPPIAAVRSLAVAALIGGV